MAKKKSVTGKKRADDGPDFEASLAEVEKIVAKLESGELGLSESLEKYETGIKQLKRCHGLLDAAEQKVSLLSGFDSDGNPVTTPLDSITQRTGAGRTVSPPNKTSKRSSGEDLDTGSIDDEAGLF